MWTSNKSPRCVIAAGLLLALGGQAWSQASEPAVVLQGFASMGYTRSSGNNFYGASTRSGGALDYRELGVNAYSLLTPNISVAAQVISRRAGQTENGNPLLDYGFVDFQWPEQDAGLRLGRVKNPLGFYNTTRDVLSTRPSILMPQSVYLEGTALRQVVFSGDGLQAYKYWMSDAGQTEIIVNWLPSRQGSDQMRRNRLPENPGATGLDLTVQRSRIAQIKHDLPDGSYQFALGYVDIPLAVTATYPAPRPALSYGVQSRAWVLSARHNAEHFSVTTEWRLAKDALTHPGLGYPFNHRFTSHSGYVQLDYRLAANALLYTRWDRLQSLGTTGTDRVVGGSWQFHRGWQANLEYHDMKGINLVATVENPIRQDRTRLFVAMLGYRF